MATGFVDKTGRKPGCVRISHASTVEELCDNIVCTLSGCNPMEIDRDDYSKVVSFLLDRNLFQALDQVSAAVGPAQRPDLGAIVSASVSEAAENMVSRGDLDPLGRMLSHPRLSRSMISSGMDLVPVLESFVRPRVTSSEDVESEIAGLAAVLPGEPFYRNTLDVIGSRLSAEMAAAKVRETVPAEARSTGIVEAAPIAAEAVPVQSEGGLSTVIKVNRIDVTIIGEPFAYGWKYKLYRARSGSGTYAFRTLSDVDPYDPVPGTIPADLASVVSEEMLWFQLTDKYPDRFVNLLETCDYPVRGQLAELASRSFGRPTDLSAQDRVSAVVAMLRSLQCMHEEGYVHNDVKPENLLLCDGMWKLFGFDASFRIGSPAVNVNGIPEYMSPEQLNGGDIDRSSDVWGAAVVLYQALTGMFPFEGRGDMYRSNAVQCRFRPGKLDASLVPVFEEVFSPVPAARPTASEFAEMLSASFL